MATEIRVEGLKELAQALRELPRQIAAKRLRKPVAAAAMMIRDDARRRAPVYPKSVGQYQPPPGTLRKSIITKYVGVGDSRRAIYIITVRHGKKYQDYGKKHKNVDAYYWSFVEFGSVHNQKKPFLVPAYEEYKNAAFRVIVSGLERAVEEEAMKLAPRRTAA